MDTKKILLICVSVLSLLFAAGNDLKPARSADQTSPAGVLRDSSEGAKITLNGTSIAVEGDGVAVDGSTATITAAGSYTISGTLADGQIIVDTDEEEAVTLILNGVTISSSTSAPIYISKAQETIIVLEADTTNTLSDASTYVFADPEEDEPNAALFSDDALTISGSGSLTVTGNYNDGIVSKNSLVIAGGTITVNAIDDGIRGKDSLVIQAGTLTVNAQGDGLKSDNAEDAALGTMVVEGGTIAVTAGGDALQAETNVSITGGDFTLSAGGGNTSQIADDASAKGIKAAVGVTIDGGTFTIDSADDAVHSNGSIVINGGTFAISTGDDGMHADATLDINGGDITITQSYEGIESAVITLNAGNLHITASDDGINVGGGDGSGMMGRQGHGGRPGQQDAFAASGDYFLTINGGYSVVDANGDGIDINGAITMTGGVVIVNGPVESMNGSLDYDAGFSITGGLLVAAGSSGMAMAPDNSSSQYSLLLGFDWPQKAGTLVHIQTSEGDEVLTFAPTKIYQAITFSSADLAAGSTYEVYLEGSSTGTVTDGLYQDGMYTPGTQYTDFTISDVVTAVGAVMSGRW